MVQGPHHPSTPLVPRHLVGFFSQGSGVGSRWLDLRTKSFGEVHGATQLPWIAQISSISAAAMESHGKPWWIGSGEKIWFYDFRVGEFFS